MFVLMSLLKIVGVIGAAILVGLILMPTDVLFVGLGFVALIAGVIYLFSQLWTGAILALCGVVMLLIGDWVRRTENRERDKQIASAQASAARASRAMDVYLPPE